jgi:hypothetical protein
MLVCLECGCSSDERAKGWTAFLAEDPDGEESPFIGVFCPVCAASEFKYRPERAADYTLSVVPGPAVSGAQSQEGPGAVAVAAKRATATPVPHLE